jgi:DNA replication protein DnaC
MSTKPVVSDLPSLEDDVCELPSLGPAFGAEEMRSLTSVMESLAFPAVKRLPNRREISEAIGRGQWDGSCQACGKGIPEDPNALQHRCCLCGDGRFVRGSYPLGDANFGKTVLCTCVMAGDTQEDKWARFYTSSGLPQLYHGARVEGIYSVEVKRKCFDFLNPWPPERPFLVFRGDMGTGKTFAAAGVLQTLYSDYGRIGRFERVIGLLKRYKATFGAGDGGETVEQIDRELLASPCLVLDDLGAEKESEWTHEQLYDLIDRRYGRRMPTIITTNLALTALEARVADRIQDVSVATVVPFTGPSRRLQA